jgi:DNA gyrase/topoisomerase IV subunit A
VYGEPINGTWQLLGCDRNEDSMQSTINQWTLTFEQATTAVSSGAPWSYTLKDSDNEDNILRVLKIRGIDASDNTTATSIIRMHIDTLRTMGRAAQGVKLINLKGNADIAAIARVPRAEDEEEETTSDNTESGTEIENNEAQSE